MKALAPDASVLQDLRDAYAGALRGTFVLALVGTCLALPFAASMQWLNVKRIAEERRERARVSSVDSIGVAQSDVESKRSASTGH